MVDKIETAEMPESRGKQVKYVLARTIETIFASLFYLFTVLSILVGLVVFGSLLVSVLAALTGISGVVAASLVALGVPVVLAGISFLLAVGTSPDTYEIMGEKV